MPPTISLSLALVALLQGGPPAGAPTTRPKTADAKKNELTLPMPVDGVAAIINNDVITQSEVDAFLGAQIVKGAIASPEDLAKERRSLIKEMAKQLLRMQAAKRLKIDDRQIEEGLKERIDEAERNAGGALALRHNIQLQGKSYDEWVTEQRNNELAVRIQRAELGFEVRPEREIVITPGMIRDFYRDNQGEFLAGPTVKAQQILLTDARSGDRVKTMEQVSQVLTMLKKGERFEELARKFSEWRPAYGGIIEWVESGKGLSKPVEDFIFTHEPGDISGPIDMGDSVSIVKVLDRRPAGVRPISDNETQEYIQRKLHELQRNALLHGLTMRLIAEAYIYPPTLFPN